MGKPGRPHNRHGRHIVPLHRNRANKWGTDALSQGLCCHHEELIPSSDFSENSMMPSYQRARFPVSYEGLDMFQVVTGMSWAESEKYRRQLPSQEQDVLILIYQYGKYESDIAKMFSMTQGAIATKLRRALYRLRFFRNPPKFPEPRPLPDNPTWGQRMIYLRAQKICDLLKSGVMHQTEIGKRLGMAQPTVSVYLRQYMINPPKSQKYYYASTELDTPRYRTTPKIVFST